MNKDVVKLVVEAARSGEYCQTENHLRVGDCYCFEGLICELYRKHANPEARWEDTDQDSTEPEVAVFVCWSRDSIGPKKYKSCGLMPKPVKDWLGGDHVNLRIDLYGSGIDRMELSFHSMNDAGMTFNQIADVLEYVYLR